MINPLIRKLELFAPLEAADHAVLKEAAAERIRFFGPHEDIVREGDEARDVAFFLSGWACRYKQIKDGRRQIVAFVLPGDVCDHNIFLSRAMDHHIGAITSVSVAMVAQETFERLTIKHPRITRALMWEALVNAAVQREWMVSLGQRRSLERIAHLFCELFFRLKAIGQTVGNACELPLSQLQLGQAVGLSTVHVNRILQEMRAVKLITLRGKALTIPDLAALMRAGSFNPSYLQVDGLHSGLL